eukprot:EG_transcript_28661
MGHFHPFQRVEALRLYRAICKKSKEFTWKDPMGRVWGEVLRESARKEMEAAREEKDPEQIARLIFMGQTALYELDKKMQEKAAELARKEKQILDDIERTRTP